MLIAKSKWMKMYVEDGIPFDDDIEELCEKCDGEGGEDIHIDYDVDVNDYEDDDYDDDGYRMEICDACGGECSSFVDWHDAREKSQNAHVEEMYYQRLYQDLLLMIVNGHLDKIDFSKIDAEFSEEHNTLKVGGVSYDLPEGGEYHGRC